MPLITGQVLNNRYRIVKELATGGFGTVYRAWDINMEKPCAIKENADPSPEAQKQFTREAGLLSNLRHANLPIVTDHFFTPNQGQFLVMDFIEGEDLQTLLNNNSGQPLEETRVVAWASQVCDALTYLHTQTPPIIHRDIKPANIRLTPNDRVVLVDFGISKYYDANAKTTTGARAVTRGYSPPEQYGGSVKTDARSDIYAFGATLYNLLTGIEPEESTDRLLGDTLKPPIAANPRLTARTASAIAKAMQPKPAHRYQTARDFKLALQRQIDPALFLSKWWKVAAAVVVGILGLTGLAAAIGLTCCSSIFSDDGSPAIVGPVGAPSPALADTVAFASNRDGDWNIYLLGDSGLIQQTQNSADDVYPAFASQANSLAFSSNRDGNWEIYTNTSAGLIRQTNNPADDLYPAIAPDGSRLAFASNRDGNWEIYLTTASGTIRQTNNPADDLFPALTADGSHLAFASDRDGNWEIYTVTAERLTRQTNDSGTDIQPAFSPDGTQLAFAAWRDNNWEIYLNTAAGLQRLTTNNFSDMNPVWSADGQKIRFASNRDGNWEIYEMNSDGSNLTNLTQDYARDYKIPTLP